MRKNLLVFLMSILMGASLMAQNVIYEDNFDSYNAGEFLAVQSDDWTTWTENPGGADDGYVVNDQSNTAPNSVKAEGGTDLIYKCGDLTSGVYELALKMYIPSGFGGYYNIEHFDTPGTEWAMEVYFGATGDGYINAGGANSAAFTYAHDTWIPCSTIINLNDDVAQLFIDGNLIHEWQWSTEASTGNAGTNQLGCVDMYAGAPTGETATYYFDDFSFTEVPNIIYSGNFDEFNAGDYLAVVDDAWTTWTENPGGADDGFVSDEQSYSNPNSVKAEGGTDLIYKCGDLTSGEYQLDLMMYVPTGFGGYYNIEHFDAPGTEWAMEVYFGATGDGYINAGGANSAAFTYAHDTWIPCSTIINLDDDLAQLYIDGNLIHEWQWSTEASTGNPGTNQLGCVDMYAGAPTGETATYYFDNFQFMSLSSGLAPPTIALDMEEMAVAISDGVAVTEPFNISNVGEQDLSYFTYPTYTVDAASGSATNAMTYAGDNASAYGYTDATSSRAAVLFLPSIVQDYVGTEITSIDFYLADDALDFKVKGFGPGSTTTPGPGEELFSQDFTPTANSWNHVVLDNPILLDGSPIWIGVEFFQPAGAHCLGIDGGPMVPGVNYTSIGVGWSEFTLDGNFNITANLTGDPMNTFMDIPVDQGIIAGGDNENVVVFFDPTDLSAGQHTGQIVVESNDQTTNYSYIDVTLDVITAVNNLNTKDAVMVYPNPTASMVFVKANSLIKEVKVSNYLGQMIDSYSFMNDEVSVDVSNYENGVYFIEVTTIVGKHTVKVVKK
jgi:hypothetical protein